jgi:hypothetical protein
MSKFLRVRKPKRLYIGEGHLYLREIYLSHHASAEAVTTVQINFVEMKLPKKISALYLQSNFVTSTNKGIFWKFKI